MYVLMLEQQAHRLYGAMLLVCVCVRHHVASDKGVLTMVLLKHPTRMHTNTEKHTPAHTHTHICMHAPKAVGFLQALLLQRASHHKGHALPALKHQLTHTHAHPHARTHQKQWVICKLHFCKAPPVHKGHALPVFKHQLQLAKSRWPIVGVNVDPEKCVCVYVCVCV